MKKNDLLNSCSKSAVVAGGCAPSPEAWAEKQKLASQYTEVPDYITETKETDER